MRKLNLVVSGGQMPVQYFFYLTTVFVANDFKRGK